MSSHHFVKEGQEPALVIADAISYNLIEPLLEWAPMVVVFDHVLDDVLHWGMKIDVIVTRAEQSDRVLEKMADQLPIDFLICDARESPVPACFIYLLKHKQTAVNFLTTDYKSVMTEALPHLERINVSILTVETRWSSVKGFFKKWLPAGTSYLVDGSMPVQCHNGLQSSVLAANVLATTKQDGIITLESTAPFWFGEQH